MQHESKTPKTEVLAVSDCWKLLRGVSVGRLAVWVDDHPELFPINFRAVQESIVFRTGPGTKLSAALNGKPVAVEADEINSNTNVAWSVVVKGHAEELQQSGGELSSRAKRLFPWEPGNKDHFISITPQAVTGRRFTIAAPYSWDIALDDALRSGLE